MGEFHPVTIERIAWLVYYRVGIVWQYETLKDGHTAEFDSKDAADRHAKTMTETYKFETKVIRMTEVTNYKEEIDADIPSPVVESVRKPVQNPANKDNLNNHPEKSERSELPYPQWDDIYEKQANQLRKITKDYTARSDAEYKRLHQLELDRLVISRWVGTESFFNITSYGEHMLHRFDVSHPPRDKEKK